MSGESVPARIPSELHTLFEEAFNRGDVEMLTSLYESEAVLVVGGKEVIGRENIRSALQSLVARGGRMTLETRGTVLSPLGIAVLHGSWVVARASETRGEATRGLSTEVVRQQPDGSWMFLVDNPYTPEPSPR